MPEVREGEIKSIHGGGSQFEFGPIWSFLEARFASASADWQKFNYARAPIIPLSFGFVF